MCCAREKSNRVQSIEVTAGRPCHFGDSPDTRWRPHIVLGLQPNIGYVVIINPPEFHAVTTRPNVPVGQTAVANERVPKKWNTFAALRHPNYKLWFQGQIVSLFGTWMQITAQGFLIYELTHSAAYLGFVGFVSGVPMWILTLYGGVIADRVQRRTLLIVTQCVMMMLAFALGAITFLGIVQPWHILVLSFLLGIANAFDAPARQAFVSEMVSREDLTNAIALNATMFNTAVAAGPAVAGITYAAFGPGWCFTINGLSFVAVIVALWMMEIETPLQRSYHGSVMRELKEGLRHVVTQRVIAVLFVVIAVYQLLVFSMSTVIPAWSVSILDGDALTNGYLLSSRGAGSLAGALVIASLGNFRYRGKLLSFGAFISAILLVLFGVFRWMPASLILLAGIGVGTIFVMNLANAVIQTKTPERLRGRVMGAYTWIFFGFMPLGALWTGAMSDEIGLAQTTIMNGLLGLAFTVLVWFKFPLLREQ